MAIDNITLRQQINEFLDDQILCKPEEQRSSLDEAVLEHGRAFADILLRLRSGNQIVKPHEAAVTRLVRGMNEINREYDLRNLDAEAIAEFRKPRG